MAKRTVIFVYYLSVLFSLGGCATSTAQKAQVKSTMMKYMQIKPKAASFEKPIPLELMIALDKAVPADMDIADAKFGKLPIKDFSRTFSEALVNTLRPNFNSIEVISYKDLYSLTLMIHHVEGRFHTPVMASKGSAANPGTKIAYDYRAALYLKGEKIADVTDSAVSKKGASSLSDIEPVYGDSVMQLCEEIQRKLFTKTIQERLRFERK